MTACHEAIAGPQVWTGEQLGATTDWLWQLSASEADELLRAVHSTLTVPAAELCKENFPLPRLTPGLGAMEQALLNGRGVVLVRGFPVERYGLEVAARAFYGLGRHLGAAVSQNANGHLLGHVIDHRDESAAQRRIYQTPQRLPFHSDSCDVVGLMCIRPAATGGESLIASAAAIHNDILRREPSTLATLYGSFQCTRWGEIPQGKLATYPVHIFNRYLEWFTCVGMDPDVRGAVDRGEALQLTPEQLRALDMFQDVAHTLAYRMQLCPGDMQFLHNHTVLHARTAFDDYPEAERRRHLLRLWLSMRNGRPLPRFLSERWGDIAVGGVRGGIRVPGMTEHVPIHP